MNPQLLNAFLMLTHSQLIDLSLACYSAFYNWPEVPPIWSFPSTDRRIQNFIRLMLEPPDTAQTASVAGVLSPLLQNTAAVREDMIAAARACMHAYCRPPAEGNFFRNFTSCIEKLRENGPYIYSSYRGGA